MAAHNSGGEHGDHAVRVHFPAEQMEQHDSEIVTQATGPDRIDVHLGFLQIRHRYQIRFAVKDALPAGMELTSDPLQNLNVVVAGVKPTEDGLGHELVVDFKANKEKLMVEELTLTLAGREERLEGPPFSNPPSDSPRTLTIVLHARVLGKGKGTPTLRRGIRCVGVDVDDESEQSDWQGFD